MSKKNKDPYFKREQEKYQDPIPSREYIMQVLEAHGRPISFLKLAQTLELYKTPQEESLGFRLRAMLRDGQLMQDRRGRYCLLKRLNLMRGKVIGHPDGFGFFVPDDKSKDMLLSAKEMRSVMHGDIVLAYPVGVDRRGRVEGKVHEVVEHVNQNIVGRYFNEQGLGFVVPDSKRITQDISIPAEFQGDAQHGQIVLVEMISFPSGRAQALGKIVKVLGEHMAPGMEIEVAILAHAIPAIWPADVLAMEADIPKVVTEADIVGRADLRDLPFVTIDGEDARDFDDAVYCVRKPKGGYILYVAIADVGHYVLKDSALDKEAARRGNSVYFPEQVIPMLPEALSNGICSLNPHVDRLCVVAEMSVSAEGKLMRSRFYKAVMHSKARLTYTEVADWIKAGQAAKPYEHLWPAISELNALYQILHTMREQRGAIDFETTETKIAFDEQRKIERIYPLLRNDAHRLIEECMLLANVAAARFIEKAKLPMLYRVHAAPEEEKITALRQFLGEFGIVLPGSAIPSPKDFQKALQKMRDKPERHLLETVTLRSLKQAEYLETNDGHFGLAYSAYTHFTSPIRRYPDLLIHRAIAAALETQEVAQFPYTDEDMHRLGKHCSMTERRADDATRDVLSWLKCEFMQDKLGQVFEGRISAVTSFGIFVQLDEIYVEGLVHVTGLRNDYYTFDAVRHRLVGERGGQVYRLGDRMKVLVARVDLDERKIDFEPVIDDVEEDE